MRSLRDWEGQPLDVMVQQDASEFLTQFFQQVRFHSRVFGYLPLPSTYHLIRMHMIKYVVFIAKHVAGSLYTWSVS